MSGSNKRTTLKDVTTAMRSLDSEIAPGSESHQWQAYVEDCNQYGYTTGAPSADDDYWMAAVDSDFVAYWLAVACEDYETASEYGDVDPDWIR